MSKAITCFSTPNQARVKRIFLFGKNNTLQKPVPLILDGKELPWVTSASHLGRELHESGDMNHDASLKSLSSSQSTEMIRFRLML